MFRSLFTGASAPTRRQMLIGLGSAAALPLLAACQGAAAPTNLSQALADLSTLASGLSGVLPSLSSIAGIPADVLKRAQTIIPQISQVAGSVSGAASASALQSPVKQIETLVNSLVSAVTPFVAAVPTVGPIFAAASVLLPVIETAIGMVVPPSAGPMSPAEARLILAAAARR